jgi:hypothetical protein
MEIYYPRDNVRKLLVDSTVATQNKEVPAATLESWIEVSSLSAQLAAVDC